MSNSGPPQELIVAGRYRVIRELGRGGMGSVYEAENLRTRRRVALKTMRPEVSERADFAHRFEREAQAAGQLRHPNIIDVLDMGDDPAYGIVFIVQEFLNGGDLSKCLKQCGALPPHAAIATLLPVMDALGAAHEQGIVHRDIKPNNIFLHETPQGVIPKLIDFGIAKITRAHSEEELSHTATGQVVGSPNYVSPEQARGDGDLDARTDVWSMGVVFYKSLSLAIPYTAPTSSALIAKIIYEEPAPLGLLAPHLPADLVAVIQRAVVKDRALRWPSMRAFADALQACALWQGVDAARAQRWVVTVRGETLEPLPAAPRWVHPGPAGVVPEHPSGVSSAQRSGPWGGEVSAHQAPPVSRDGRTPHRLAGAVTLLSLGIAATAAFLWPRTRTRPASDAPAIHATAPAPRGAAVGHDEPSRVDAAVAAPAVAAPAVAAPAVAAPAVAAPAVAAPSQPVAVQAVAAPEVPAEVAPPSSHARVRARSTSSVTHDHSTATSPSGATRRGRNGALILR